MLPRLPLRPAAALLLAAVLGCGDDGPTSVDRGAPLVRHVVRPLDTEPALGGWFDDHLAWVDTAARPLDSELFVFLGGTNGRPEYAQLIGEHAARLGYRVVSLMYPNDRAVVQWCAGDPAEDCMERMRREIIEGVDLSPHVSVGPADAIDNRLLRLLQHLADRYPAEGWSAFLEGGAVRWDRVAVGGHSQGGGHAALIGTRRQVARVVMFGAPADGYQGAPAPWMAIGATPAERYFGFAHLRDPFTSIEPNWVALGLPAFGNAARVESGAPPWGGTHMLVTDWLPRTGSWSDAHTSVVSDFATPRLPDGRPAFAAAWRHLLGGAR